jgi:hypothetical protein
MKRTGVTLFIGCEVKWGLEAKMLDGSSLGEATTHQALLFLSRVLNRYFNNIFPGTFIILFPYGYTLAIFNYWSA